MNKEIEKALREFAHWIYAEGEAAGLYVDVDETKVTEEIYNEWGSIQVLKKALERNEPKRVAPPNSPNKFAGKCPNCGYLIWREMGRPNYCQDCGQALDWKQNDE